MLKTIEQMTGKSISDLFDWVVGTSTGGILALGMIYGKDNDYVNVICSVVSLDKIVLFLTYVQHVYHVLHLLL